MRYTVVMRQILLVLPLLSVLSGVAQGQVQNPLTFVQAGRWAEAQAAARAMGPLAEKVTIWYRLLAPNAAGAAEIAAFARQNPDWPLPTLMERRRQEALAAERDTATVAALCTEKKPIPTPGRGPALLRCAEALAALGRGAEAAILAREAWVAAISDPATENAFLARFPGIVTAQDQWARFQRLAWDDTAGAQRQMARLDPASAAKASGRLALKAGNTGYNPAPADDPGGILDLAKLLRRANQNAAAAAVWRASGTAAQKAAPDHLDAFWPERHQLTRALMKDGDYAAALATIAGHGQTDPANAAEAEFLAGFIALRKLNDPVTAAKHFSALAAASPAVLTQSRAYYWLGRAKLAAGGDGKAEFARSAAWPMTFYGQLAARAAGIPDATLIQNLRIAPTPAPGLAGTAGTAELAQAARLLLNWGDPRRARPFLLRMDEVARSPGERIAVTDFAAAIGLPDIAVLVTRRLGRDGVVPPMQGWPVPVEPPNVVEPALSLAISRQESNFDVAIVSPAGARGLMQLMPATARQVARRLGEPTSDLLLTSDPNHNMRLGTAYLREVLDKFDNYVPLAAAAYNAGPHRVTQWLAENGDPRAGGQDMIDWIETIPFNETRNYVHRVLENTVVYQARRAGTLPGTIAQWSR